MICSGSWNACCRRLLSKLQIKEQNAFLKRSGSRANTPLTLNRGWRTLKLSSATTRMSLMPSMSNIEPYSFSWRTTKRARQSNIHIRGIPESVINLQSTITALFQKLSPSILIERLEMDRIHRTPAPRKPDGPPHDIVFKIHFYRTKKQLLTAAGPTQDSPVSRLRIPDVC